MLTYFPIGPTEDQTYMVGYETPGCRVRTIVYEHLNEQDAIKEAARLNRDQQNREKVLRAERNACGLHGAYLDPEERQ